MSQSEISFLDSEVPADCVISHIFYPADAEARHGMHPDFTLRPNWKSGNAYVLLMNSDHRAQLVIYNANTHPDRAIIRAYAATGFKQKLAEGTILSQQKLWKFIRPFDVSLCLRVFSRIFTPDFVQYYGDFQVAAPNGDRLERVSAYLGEFPKN